jgi:hypothetical protein
MHYLAVKLLNVFAINFLNLQPPSRLDRLKRLSRPLQLAAHVRQKLLAVELRQAY